MPECRYCGETFEDDDAYLHHLEDVHPDDLGPIDRRRLSGDDDGIDIETGPLAVGGVVLVVAVAVVYVVFFAGGSGGSPDGETTPHRLGSVHYHGTIEVTIAGERIDFSRPEYQYRSTGVDPFHFEGGDGTRWHVHAQDVTLRWAMGSLGIGVTETTVTFDGTTYRDGDGATVIVEVNGQSVVPSEYVLQRDDHVRIVVGRDGG